MTTIVSSMQYSDAISKKSESGSDDVFDIKRIDNRW